MTMSDFQRSNKNSSRTFHKKEGSRLSVKTMNHKDKEREKINKQIEEFVAKGGVIDELPIMKTEVKVYDAFTDSRYG